jgi:ribosome maturation factor RimP
MNWQDAAQRTVTGLKYELVDLERTGGGLLRVYIDRVPGTLYPTGASELVTVDDCEVVTRQLQYVLEVEQCDYTRLEVSSPGLDRPLKREADYARFVGSVVALTLKLPLAGRKKFEGVLAAREGGWRLEMAPAVAKGVKGGMPAKTPMGPELMALDFVLDEVREANLVPVVDFKGRARVKGAETAPMQAVPSHVGE